MPTYYVGPGGNDGNSGLSYALRKLTLNGVEDIPVVAGDFVWVTPAAYREMLTVDVSGGAGTEIVYQGDVTGEHTDGIGGIVRITGSDNDQGFVRTNCIVASGRSYRTFRGFYCDGGTTNTIGLTDCTNIVFEDMFLVNGAGAFSFYSSGASQANITLRRSFVYGGGVYAVHFIHSVEVDNANHLVENCIVTHGRAAILMWRVGGSTVRNCLLTGNTGMWALNLSGGQTITVNNCILTHCATAAQAGAAGMITEDYNTFSDNATNRTNVAVGANSVTYPPIHLPPIFNAGASQASGYKFPWWFGELSEWSQVRAITGSNEPSVDLLGIPRPATASKNSWGPMQFADMEMESGTVQAGSYARALLDAGDVLVRRVPSTNVSTTVTLYMRYETNYAGTLPQMIIKQPGQADRVSTMVAAADTWEQLSDTFTPAALPGYFEVWARSSNTAGAGNFKTIYDTMDIS